MADDPPDPAGAEPAPDGTTPAAQPVPLGSRPAPRPDRLAREAAALRANLRKRKDQARERAGPPDPPKRG